MRRFRSNRLIHVKAIKERKKKKGETERTEVWTHSGGRRGTPDVRTSLSSQGEECRR